MTLSRYNELAEYWVDHPPVHVLLAAFLEVKPRASKTPATLEALIDDWSSLGLGVERGWSGFGH